MKVYILFIFSCFIHAEALECGIKALVDNSMKRAITNCLSKNMTLNDIYDFSANSPKENEAPLKNKEDEGIKRNATSSNETKIRKTRSTRTTKFDRQVSEITTTNQPETETDQTTVETFSQQENCILQCILSRMNLTNQKGLPDQEKITNLLTKHSRGRELMDFLKDTTENCFRKLKEDSSKDSCDYSVELIRCMANEGKFNCGDWPAGDISLFN
ncbi:odorant-binding protein 59a [Coccinella septempunctata]|uniref:odorant-binding protein 59a n=1 Tax=Coccinella septempunctata TaxID=41139 RepID=UPI001D06BBB7|nr:odorant-binding protein 59a [Coccinella septempunctata]